MQDDDKSWDSDHTDIDEDDRPSLDYEDHIDHHAETQAENTEQMISQRAEWALMAAWEAYIYFAEAGEGNKAYRKSVFVEKKNHAKLRSGARLEAENAEALEKIERLKRDGKKSVTYEDTAKAYYYVLDDEGEERARKGIFRSKKREAS